MASEESTAWGTLDEARWSAFRERSAAEVLIEALSAGAVTRCDERMASLAGALQMEGLSLTEAARGRPGDLLLALQPDALPSRAPLTLHVVAVAFARLARAVELRLDSSPTASPDEVTRWSERARALRAGALTAWCLLAAQGEWLRTLVMRQDPLLSAEQAQAATSRRPVRVLRTWLRAASPLVLARAASGRVCCALLRDVERGALAAGSGLEPHFEELAEELLEPAIEQLIERDRVLATADATVDQRVAVLVSFPLLWDYVGRHELVALRAVQRAVELGWELRSTGKTQALARLLTPMLPMLDALAEQVHAGSRYVAFAALIADAWAQFASTPVPVEERVLACERALVVCPRHRLAESMLAFYLASQALGLLEVPRRSAAVHERIEQLLRRAHRLDAGETRVIEALEAYRRVHARALDLTRD